MLTQLKRSKSITKSYQTLFVGIFFRNFFFMFFSFCNCFLPIAISFIAAYGPTGKAVDYVLAIGMIAGFMISFYQLGFIFSLAMLNISAMLKMRDQHFSLLKREQFLAQEYLVSFLIGLVLMGVYCGVCYGYVKYGGGYLNTHVMAVEGYQFAFGTSPTIVLSLIISMTLFNVFAKLGNLKATLIVISQLVINLFFVGIVGLFGDHDHNFGMYGYAVGLDIGMVVNLIIIFLVAYLSWIRIAWRISFSIIKHFYKLLGPMFAVSLVNTWTVFIRVFIILAIAFKFDIDHRAAPYNLMFARIFYFYAIYALIFIGNGATYTLAYLKVRFRNYPNLYIYSYKVNWLIPTILAVIAGLVAIMYYFTMPYLFQHYIIHAAPATNPYTYLAWKVMYEGQQLGVAGFIALPYNMSVTVTCVAVVCQTAAFAFDLFPDRPPKPRKPKKDGTPRKPLSPFAQFAKRMLPQLIFPTVAIGFVIGFGLGTMGHGPFQFLAAFAVPYLIFSLAILLLRVVVYIIVETKFAKAFKLLNPSDVVISYLTLLMRYRYWMYFSRTHLALFWNQFKKGLMLKKINH